MAASGTGGGGASGKSIRAGKAFVAMSLEDSGLRTGLQRAKERMLKFGASVGKIGAGILGAGIFKHAAESFKDLLQTVPEMSRLATKLGVGTEQLSEFAYAAQTTGQSFEDLSGHFENLAERVAQGADGAGEAANTFKKLGIDANQLKLQNPIDQLISIADAMQNVTNETERLGMLSSLGGDQFQNLNALFKQGGGGIRALMQEGKDVGASLSGETAKNAMKAQQAFTRSWTAIKSVALEVFAAITDNGDTIKEIATWIVGGAKAVRLFISENKSLVTTILAVGAAIVTGGIAFIGIGTIFAGIATAVGGFTAAISAVGTVIGAIATPAGAAVAIIVAIGAAVAGATYAFVKFTDIGQTLWTTLKATMGEVWGTFKTTFGGITDAIKGGNFSLAWDIACKGMRVVWNDLVIGLKSIWNDFMKWYFTKTMDGVKSVAKAFGFDELLERVTGAEEEGKKKFLEMMGLDLSADIAHRDKLKRELEELAKSARPKDADTARPLDQYQRVDVNKYIGRLGENARGLFQAPNLNAALGVGTKVTTEKAIVATAKNTELTAKRVAELQGPKFA